MTTPGQKLAESLEIVRNLQLKFGGASIKASEVSRTHRERLQKNGFLLSVAKGWYLAISPSEKAGSSTSWFMSYWHFCSRYLQDKYGDGYCLSAEQSLMMHAGNFDVPVQLIVRAPGAPNKIISLPFQTSIFEMQSRLPQKAETTVLNGIRLMTLPFGLINCSRTLFENSPVEMRTVLAQITDSSEILRPLLDGSHSVVAGRLAGAFRNVNQTRIADEIIKTMKAADFDIRESDPFAGAPPIGLSLTENSPYANRLRLHWHAMREIVIKNFPEAPGLPSDPENYLAAVDQIYVTDAYHSLSIELYTVPPELIEKIRSGEWDLETNEADRKQRDAMAARGYWQANLMVMKSLEKILAGSNPGAIVDQDHGDWYRAMFSPAVAAGLIKSSDLAGYRSHQVYISQSKHVPLNKEAVRTAMPVLFELLVSEENPAVRAVLGHFFFVYIHPYMDGNGRIARFLMNVMLGSGGYPWTVIPVEQRETYMDCLEKASVDGDIEPFSHFVGQLVASGLSGNPVANLNSSS